MARKGSIAKEKRRERLVKQKWNRRQELKDIVKDLSKSDEERLAAALGHEADVFDALHGG